MADITKFERYVLEYKDVSGNFVCNMSDYYERFVKPLGVKFRNGYLALGREAICPLHDDHDPSLGVIKSKKIKGVLIYHCFGCGSSGTVIRFHQRVELLYHNRKLSVDDACRELCQMFDIPIPNMEELADDDYEGKFAERSRRIDIGGKYSFRDYSSELLGIRKRGGMVLDEMNLERVNRACVKYIATSKGLYER